MSMQAELQALLSLKPVIDGDTAEFRVPRIIHVVKNKSLFEGTSGDLEEEEVGERLIRFSRINGAWRFFDGNATTNVELEAALTRQAPMEISDNEWLLRRSEVTGGCLLFRECRRYVLCSSVENNGNSVVAITADDFICFSLSDVL